jgi:hypothetical protein
MDRSTNKNLEGKDRRTPVLPDFMTFFATLTLLSTQMRGQPAPAIPTGTLSPAEGTPFDFRSRAVISNFKATTHLFCDLRCCLVVDHDCME